jgi:universal stress protein A
VRCVALRNDGIADLDALNLLFEEGDSSIGLFRRQWTRYGICFCSPEGINYVEYQKIKTILHPTDFSPNADQALPLAYALARDYRARLILLHVATAPTVVTHAELLPVLEMNQEEFKAQLRQRAASHADVHPDFRLEHGDPTAEVLRVAQEVQADLIVMGTHGRTGIGRLLMGSVAEHVLREAPCPVVIVKTAWPSDKTPS